MSDYLQKTLSCDQLELSSMELGYTEFSKLAQNPWILTRSLRKRSAVCLNCERTFTFSDFLKRDTREQKAVRNIKRFKFLAFTSQTVTNIYYHASPFLPVCESYTLQYTLRSRESRRESKQAQLWKSSDNSVIKQNLPNDRKYSMHLSDHMSKNLTITRNI